MSLSDIDQVQIDELAEEGNRHAENGEFDEAIDRFQKALGFIPIPRNNWEANTWLLASIGDMYFLKENWETASSFLFDALNSLDGPNSAFIIFRLGQCLYEAGRKEQSKEYLFRAFMLEGESIFSDEDPKYMQLIKYLI